MEQPKMSDLQSKLAGDAQPSSAAEELRQAMQDMLDQDNHQVKGLAAQSKKQLAREVVHLRAMIKVVQNATRNVRIDGHRFGHAEAFMLMTYKEVDGEGSILVWNSRDGVTPFVINIGSKKYQHDIPRQQGPFFDLPREHSVSHVWVTRTDAQVLEAWRRTMDRAVELGKIDPEKAAGMRDNLEVAESWHYRIGLRNLETGRFTDEEVLEAAHVTNPNQLELFPND